MNIIREKNFNQEVQIKDSPFQVKGNALIWQFLGLFLKKYHWVTKNHTKTVPAMIKSVACLFVYIQDDKSIIITVRLTV